MSPLAHFDGLEAFRWEKAEPIHLAIGMFDGVHLGHQAVLRSARHAARHLGGVAGALTFWPHPSHLFAPQRAVPMILNPDQKAGEFGRLGMAFMIQQRFDRAFASIEAERFVDHLLECIPELATLHTGENWRFGSGRKGDAALLARLAQEVGLSASIVDTHSEEGGRVSSTRIRELLVEGEVAEANRLLGYDYFTCGTVTPGRQLGASIGVPTLNLPFEGDLQPKFGVYLVRVREVSSDYHYKAVANFGIRPTANRSPVPILEVHVLEDCPYKYGDRLHVDWLRFIRPEKRFGSVEELQARIQEDILLARACFEEGE